MAKAVFDEQTGQESNKPEDLGSQSASDMRNQLSALYQGDLAPLRARAQDVPDMTIQVNPAKVQSFFAQVNRDNQPVIYAGGNSPSISAPSGNPRIDVLYLSSGGSLAWVTGSESSTPSADWVSLPEAAIPVATVYAKTTMTTIVNFEDKDANANEGYVYEDVRPFLSLGGGAQPSPYDAVVNASGGGDYTTIEGAYGAGHKNILVMPGEYDWAPVSSTDYVIPSETRIFGVNPNEVIIKINSNTEIYFGGTTSTESIYSTGTVTSLGSGGSGDNNKKYRIQGNSTSWSGNVNPGDILVVEVSGNSNAVAGIVKEVLSDTLLAMEDSLHTNFSTANYRIISNASKGISLENLQFINDIDTSQDTIQTPGDFHIYLAWWSSIKNCFIKGIRLDANGAHYLNISHNILQGCGRNAFTKCINLNYSHNMANGVEAFCWMNPGLNEYCNVIGNIVTGCWGVNNNNGCIALTDPSNDNKKILIANNILTGINTQYGCRLDSRAKDCVVVGNIFEGTITGLLDGGTNTVTAGNKI